MKCVSVYSTNSLGPGKLVSNEDISKSIIIICSSMTTWKVFGTFYVIVVYVNDVIVVIVFLSLEKECNSKPSLLCDHIHFAYWFVIFNHQQLQFWKTICLGYQQLGTNGHWSDGQNENGRWYIMMKCGVFITRSIFSKMLTIDTQSSPVRARFGVFVVILISDSLSATVIAVSCVIPWSTRPRYSALDYISHCYLNLKFRPDGVCNVTKT